MLRLFDNFKSRVEGLIVGLIVLNIKEKHTDKRIQVISGHSDPKSAEFVFIISIKRYSVSSKFQPPDQILET